MASTFLNDKKVRPIHLGSTYKRKRQTALHTLRYDFKPASVDLSQTGRIEVGENNEVEVTLPSSKNSGTVYKGSKKPALKECVLIYDPATDEFTLERVTSQIHVKKTRPSSNNKVASLPQANIPKLPSKRGVPPKKSNKSSKQPATQQQQPAHARKADLVQEDRMERERSISPIQPKHANNNSSSMADTYANNSSSMPDTFTNNNLQEFNIPNNVMETLSSSGSSSSSSSSSDEDDDSDNNVPTPNQNSRSPIQSQLHDDLQLTSSGSDSD